MTFARRPPLVAFASDYGLADPFVGLCHLACHRSAAEADAVVTVVDLCHTLPAFDPRAAAVVLGDALPWVPDGAVVLAVVDPGVGTERAGVVVRAAPAGAAQEATEAGGADAVGWWLVGPDNGLLTGAAAVAGATVGAAWRIPDRWRADPPVAATARTTAAGPTFDGRDLFAPLAARLAVDADGALAGLTPADPADLHAVDLPAAEVVDGRLACEVVRVDGFGNAALSATAEVLTQLGWQPGRALVVHVGSREHPATLARTFGDLGAGALGLLADAFGRLQLGVDRGDAAAGLNTQIGAGITVAVADGPSAD